MLYLLYGFDVWCLRLFLILFSFFNIFWSGFGCGLFVNDSFVFVLKLDVGFLWWVIVVGWFLCFLDFLVELFGCGFLLEVGNFNMYLYSFFIKLGFFKGMVNMLLINDI